MATTEKHLGLIVYKDTVARQAGGLEFRVSSLGFVTLLPGESGTRMGHPPLRCGPALDANRGLTSSALPRSVGFLVAEPSG